MPRRIFLARAGVSLLAVGIVGLAASNAGHDQQSSARKPAAVLGIRIGIWQPPPGFEQIPLWPRGAPDQPAIPSAPERSETGVNPKRFAALPVTGVYNVAVPTLTIFPSKHPGVRPAMLVFPGGGFKQLAIDLEGTEACDWINAQGITCVLVKYRVPDSNHHYDAACDCAVTPKHPLALQDAQRAIRMVRARAVALQIDPGKIGVMGFSAGGYLVAQTSNIPAPAYKPIDAIDRVSSRPDFAVALYPGHLCRAKGQLDPELHVTKRTPPTFLLQSWDDPTDPVCNSIVYARALTAAGVPAEVHLFAQGGHAFGFRRVAHPIEIWPSLLKLWLKGVDVI